MPGLFDDLIPVDNAGKGGMFDDLVPQKDAKPDIGRAKAAGMGLLQGVSANFGDEIAGVMAASGGLVNAGPGSIPVTALTGLAKLGYEYLSGKNDQTLSSTITGQAPKGAATARYETTRDSVREATKTAEEQYPGTTLAGNIGGAVLSPAGKVGKAVTTAGKVGKAALAGFTYGGLSGIGEVTDAADRAAKGATGAVVGGGLGAAAVPVSKGIEAAGKVASNLASPLTTAIRGIRDPEAEAARRVTSSIARDFHSGPPGLTAPEFSAARAEGKPVTLMEMGGETTRSLARSAANTSPEGRAVLDKTISDRFENQTPRVKSWLNDTFHYPNAAAQQEAIDQTAKTVNRARYAKAYQEGDTGLWSPELERLTSSPDVVDAMRNAATKGKSRAVKEGFGGFNPGVTVDQSGNVAFQKGPTGVPTYPNLQFWDYTKRAIDDASSAAQRAGRNEEASTIAGLGKQLRSELDNLVPSYGKAREGAHSFFNAENSLEAGQNFVMQNFNTTQTRSALSKMTQNERQLFQDGFVSRFIEVLDKAGDRRNILNQIGNNPAAREKLQIALGPQKSKELEAMLRVEGVMDLARGAVQGNSTTARQLAELGLAGGTYTVGTGGNVTDPNASAIMNAALVYGAAKGKGVIDQRVAKKVAEFLTSDNPAVLKKGIAIVANNSKFLGALRATDQQLARAGGQQGPSVAPTIQGAVPGRADTEQPQP